MTQVPPPGPPPPPPPAPPPPPGPGDPGVTISGPGAPPPKKGLSTGVKVAIGLSLFVLLVAYVGLAGGRPAAARRLR